MKNINNSSLTLAIQKDGRLTADTLNLLRDVGLEFESYKQRLFSVCRNFPLNIVYLRDDDIPDYVASGSVDMGIVGQNMLYETSTQIDTLIELNFGFCSLCVAVPRESSVNDLRELRNCKVATSYPKSTQKYFTNMDVAVDIATIKGSVEIAPALGMADAVIDLVSTGSTLALNDLRVIDKVYDSQAVLVATRLKLTNRKAILMRQLLMRIRGVLSAGSFKYVMMNAPQDRLQEIREVVPGLKSPTITPLSTKGWISVQTVVKEDVFWETIEKLKKIGASGILVLPVEKVII